ncbi:MAG: class I SAM-dependent methyltransferase [Candidatus Nitrosocaldaceae archaeon]
MDMESYIFGHSDIEHLRLKLQAELFEEESKRTLELAGIKKGMKCVDFGCGNGYTSILLAKLVGEEGKVTAVDISEDALHAAEDNAKRYGINNIEFVKASIYDSKLEEDYDLAYSRFLFTHLAYPERAVKEFVRVVKHNGIVAVEDFNHELRITYPYNKHLERLRACMIESLKREGAIYDTAGMLYGMFKDCNIDAKVSLYAICCPMNYRYNMLPILFANVLKDNFISNGLISESEYEDIINGVKEFAQNNNAILLYSPVFRVYGLKI